MNIEQNTLAIEASLVLFLVSNEMNPRCITALKKDDIAYILGQFDSPLGTPLQEKLRQSKLPIVFLAPKPKEKAELESFIFIVVPTTLPNAEFYFAKEKNELKKIGTLTNIDPEKGAYGLILQKTGQTTLHDVEISTTATKLTVSVKQFVL